MDRRSDRPATKGRPRPGGPSRDRSRPPTPNKEGCYKKGPHKEGASKDGPRKGGQGKSVNRRDREDGRREDGRRDDRPPKKRNVADRGADAAPDARGEPDPLAARRAAVDLLMMVENDVAFDEALEYCHSFKGLTGSDRAFARNIASSVLRRRGSLDAVIGDHLDRPFPKRARRAMHILRVAAAQSVILETPDHATVSTAVELAKAYQETAGLSGVVNAVARKVAATGAARAAALPPRIDAAGWLWRSWERAYGPAGARAIAAAHREKADLDLTLKSGDRVEEFRDRLGAKIVGAGSLRRPPATAVAELPGFNNGEWWVQDAAASLPALLFPDLDGRHVIDLCAAPGGKTLQLAAAGARVTAVDQSKARLERLEDNLRRTGLSAEIVVADARNFKPGKLADAVLLDAPCTATGTIRRHPDVTWAKSETQMAALATLQAQLIDHAADMVKPGGTLVYCVCSLQPDEGERQLEAALARRPDLVFSPLTDAMDGPRLGDFARAITPAGALRTTPATLGEAGGCDGFFAARFIKAGGEGNANDA